MIKYEPFEIVDGKQTYVYTLQDKITVKIVTCGATIISLETPDKNGNMVDVLLGMTNAKDIMNTPSYMGSVIGRCANRIKNGIICVDGRKYQLAKNDGMCHLHGGNYGFNKKLYDARIEDNSLLLSSFSPDMEENYPGNLSFTVKYTVSGSTLDIEYFAECDATTVLNPTNHAYFNLDGHSSGSILNNIIQIFSEKYLPINADLVPTGEERLVDNTVFDFRVPKAIGRDIEEDDEQLKIAGGYDHNFCLSSSHAARSYSNITGITLDCYTDMPGVQFYVGNFLDGEVGKSVYKKRSGFCLETQFYPNSINIPRWKQPLIKKGEKFYSKTSYVFGIND